jgi:hypothetical protein
MTKIARVQGRINEIIRAHQHAELNRAEAKYLMAGVELEYIDVGCNSAKMEVRLRCLFKAANERLDRDATRYGVATAAGQGGKL